MMAAVVGQWVAAALSAVMQWLWLPLVKLVLLANRTVLWKGQMPCLRIGCGECDKGLEDGVVMSLQEAVTLE